MVNRELLKAADLSENETEHQNPTESGDAKEVTIDPYACPEFTQRLIQHMHRAKIAALADAEE